MSKTSAERVYRTETPTRCNNARRRNVVHLVGSGMGVSEGEESFGRVKILPRVRAKVSVLAQARV